MTKIKRLYCIMAFAQRTIGIALSAMVLWWLIQYEYQKSIQLTYPLYIIIVMIVAFISFLITVLGTGVFICLSKYKIKKLTCWKWDNPLCESVSVRPFLLIAIPMCSSPVVYSIADRLDIAHGMQAYGFFTSPGGVVMALSLLSIGIVSWALKK